MTLLQHRRFGFGVSRLGSSTSLGHRELTSALAVPTSLVLQSPWLQTSKALRAHREFQAARKAARDFVDEQRVSTGRTVPMRDALGEVGAPALDMKAVYHAQLGSRFLMAMDEGSGYEGRLTWFWSNHFCIAGGSETLRLIAPGILEAEAIKPNVHGSFADLLIAASMHWVMLRYLNGINSIGPHSDFGVASGLGLNENWAREILELHTLGVDGGYTHDDILALAEILTGWRYRGIFSDDAGSFEFEGRRHEPGPKTLLGKTYREEGVEQGLAALRDLASHPSTARHLATKLARHFVADVPPKRLVRQLSSVFLETDGDLHALSRALIEAPEAAELPAAKLRLPQEFLVAMMRATGLNLEPEIIDDMCRVMGQPLWQPPGPDGYPDTVSHWLSPEGMKLRLDVAMAVAQHVHPTLDPLEVLEVQIGDIVHDDTRLTVERAESREQAFALLFMSPEFQWR